ncbi:hypothetical protein FGB62_23g111 [Gracilaria domingensis]|nr:hypothetical protein FGB62_23g111 [Gracilaria domingensis]
MLIVHGLAGTFVLGIVYGLGEPHTFAKTPFMAGQRPVTRRFAVDLSVCDAVEFLETNYFLDGKMAVVFRRFLHINDGSLPCVVDATLHEPCDIPHTLGPLIMRINVLEAPACPNCGRCGKRCMCSFDSYLPSGAITHNCFSWNQLTAMVFRKAQRSLARFRITARLANVGDVCITHTELPVRTVVDRGHGRYITLLKRKAVHGMGLDVVPVRLESPLLSSSISNDFLDLHNHYVVRKRRRQPDQEQLLTQTASAQDGANLQEALQTIDISELPTDCNLFSDVSANEMRRLLDNTDNTLAPSQSIQFDTLPTTHSLTEAALNSNAPPELFTPPLVHNLGNPPVTTLGTHYQPELASTDIAGQQNIVDDIENILRARMSATATQAHQTTPSPHAMDFAPQPPSNQISEVNSGESHQHPDDMRSNRSTKKARTSSASLSTNSTASGSSDVSEKKHICSTCSARFKMRGDLLRHIRTVHEGKKRYQCPRCPKAFGHSGHLNRHIQSVHLQQRRFKCNICGFQFFQASHLQSHMGHVHNPNKPFKCSDCGVRVNSKVALRTHRTKTKCGTLIAESNAGSGNDVSPPVPSSQATNSQRLSMGV